MVGSKRFSIGSASILPLEVPEFQRSYKWTPKMGEKLLKDLIFHTYAGTLVGDAASQDLPKRSYHLGHLLTYTETGSHTPIVDGQQRLFTLTIIAAKLRDKALALGLDDIAYNIDSKMLWGTGSFSDSEMAFKPQDLGHKKDAYNPFKVLLRICQLEHEIDVVKEVGQLAGQNVSLQLQEFEPNWIIRKGVEIEFDNGAVFKVTNEVSKGATTTSLSGDLDNDVPDGTTGKIILGRKSGSEPAKSSILGKAIKTLDDTLSDFIDTNKPNLPGHIGTPEKRCEEMYWSLYSIDFDTTNFNTAGDAVRHFGIKNSEDHRLKLSPFDMLRALVIEIRDHNAANRYKVNGTDEKPLHDKWQEIVGLLDAESESGQKKTLKYYLEAKNGKLDADVFSVISEEVRAHFNHSTQTWDKPKVTAIFDVMKSYVIFCQESTGKLSGTVPAARHDEEFYLLAMPNAFKQWIPVYMAARMKFKDASTSENNKYIQITNLLKHFARWHARSAVLNNLNSDIKFIQANELFTLIPKWVGRINALPAQPTLSKIKKVVKDIGNEIDTILSDGGIDQNYWTGLKTANHKFSNTSNTDIRFMLLLLEKDKGKLKDGHGRYYANTTAADVEHVLEKSLKFADKAADYVFTQAEFDSVDGKPNDGSIKHRLGNRMLLPRATNQHIKKLSFAGKMDVPGCTVGNKCGGNYHYVPQRAEYAYVDEFLNRYQAGALWNPDNIDDWEKHLISEFIDLSI